MRDHSTRYSSKIRGQEIGDFLGQFLQYKKEKRFFIPRFSYIANVLDMLNLNEWKHLLFKCY